MFEEEQDNKIYNLIITQGIDPENEYKEFTAKLFSKPEFLWTETVARDYSAFSEKFFEKVDLIVILSGLYNENKEMIEDLIQVSENFDIPILLVRPYGMEIVPEGQLRYCLSDRRRTPDRRADRYSGAGR